MLRTQRRGELSVVAQVKPQGADCPVIDISLGGICLACKDPLSKGKIVDLVFNIPGEIDPVSCKARVCWCQPEKGDFCKTGFCFTQVVEEDRERIMQFVIEHSLSLAN